MMIRPSAVCVSCGRALAARHTGRKRRYCSDRCRDAQRRQLNFEFCGTTRYPCQAKPRNAENSRDTSGTSQPGFAGQGCANKRLWRSIVELEVYAGRNWSDVVSTDGVLCQVATRVRPIQKSSRKGTRQEPQQGRLSLSAAPSGEFPARRTAHSRPETPPRRARVDEGT